VGTKNLPDAIDWHFAGTWTQIFSDFPEYKGKDLEKVWKQSSDLLRRSIAIPIIVDITKEKLDAQISVISEALQKS
jgi:8-amino-3,8-dideoxy-alpha-D-manno-octulosonate transaminase